MKRGLCYLLVGFFAVFLQTGVFPRFVPAYAKPDLFIILIVYLSLSETPLRGGLIAWLMGVVKDVFVGLTLGLHGFVFLIAFFVVKGTERRLNTENSFLLVLLVFLGTFFVNGLTALTLLILADSGDSWQVIVRQIPLQMLSTSGVALALLMTIRRLDRHTGLQARIPGLRYIDNRYES